MKSPFQLIVTRNGASKGRILSGGRPITLKGLTPNPPKLKPLKVKEPTVKKTKLELRRIKLTPPGTPVERPYLERHQTMIGEFKKRKLI